MHLAVVQTHPIQYYVPVYRHLQEVLGVRTSVVYGCDAGLQRYRDEEFGRDVAWDLDLRQGYESVFLSRDADRRPRSRGLRRTLCALAPDAVLLTGYSPRFNALAALTAAASGHRLMLRADATDVSHQRSFVHATARDLALKTLYRRIRYFLYVGRNARAHYRRLGVAESRMGFSPLSVAGEHFLPMSQAARCRARVRRELSLPGDTRIVLFSGKFSPKKAPLQLLGAGELLAPSLAKRVAFVFMGDGPLDRELRRRGPRAHGPQVRVVGFKNQSELSPYYHACDLLALPSLYRETWGLVVNEALMHGKPCLVSDRVGCHGDLIQDGVTGHVHRHGDVQDMAAALGRCLVLSKRPETAAACLQKVSAYSTAASAEGIRDALGALG